MALARARRGESGMNYWPGFVDALSTLILSIIFLLTVFVVVQFYLQQEVASQNSALSRLDAQVAQLTELLSMEKSRKAQAENQLVRLQATLTDTEKERDKIKAAAESERQSLQSSLATAEKERDQAKAAAESAGTAATTAQGKAGELSGQLEGQKKISADALAQVETLNQQIAALRSQLAAIENALDLAEKKNKESESRITDLGNRLNLALAEHVNELKRYRSDFFGKLREILGDRPDIRIVGDRFVFQSEVFFDSGRSDLKPDGRVELDKLAGVLLALQNSIPADLPWVLRVDGHTDVRPVTGLFKTNWDLSAARAISVVRYLIGKGVLPQRLVAAGFGEFQPIDSGTTEDAFRRNRRIEFKLTER
jgi:chemotaxis protein MotB